ncbi:lysophospholipid acyltransferase family protein [Geothrix sp. PMB-07]|uniref:lysophospholipid acyltransferase family protein n=1 Tax=Geothrix sp. PMB-07 TaxID=3068640 RepID=UPI002742265F|nr:lysophospholipid acyltransferase family protein [Geothrix sp. PMB-07]WLT31847.1 lysophospholipid acyltransferase family protein [Geothrix sp. PMB-07]
MAVRVAIAERGRPLGSPLSVWLSFRMMPFLAAGLSKLWSYTLRVKRIGFEGVEDLVARDERFILSFWHRRLFMMPLSYPFIRKERGVAILSSDSKDGERSAATWRWFGIHAVRGTASDDGAKALVRMIQAVKQGWDFGITPDGPRGPLMELKPGVTALARKTGAWIVPVTLAFDQQFELKTWDRMVIPMPFSTCTIRYGTPYRIPPKADDQVEGQRLQREMDDLEAWAEEITHG